RTVGANNSHQFALPNLKVDVAEGPDSLLTVTAFFERRSHEAAEHFAERHVPGMQTTDAVALADVCNSDRGVHLSNSNYVSESVLKTPEDKSRAHEERHGNSRR